MRFEYLLRPDVQSKYKHSMKATDAEFSREDELKRQYIILHLVKTCDEASRYSWESEKKARKADTEALDNCETAANAASKLSLILKKHPQQFGFAISGASLKSGVFLRKKEDSHPVGHVPALTGTDAMRLAELLKDLEGLLNKKKILAKAGPMIHRTRHGPLHFPKPIENQSNLPAPETCLAVYLSAIFRSYDEFKDFAGLQPGSPIPRTGKPRWKLVEQWVQDTFPGAGAAEGTANAKQLLKRRKDLEIWHYN